MEQLQHSKAQLCSGERTGAGRAQPQQHGGSGACSAQSPQRSNAQFGRAEEADSSRQDAPAAVHSHNAGMHSAASTGALHQAVYNSWPMVIVAYSF